MSGFQEDVLRGRLDKLTVAQDSIETLSLWIRHHRRYARRVVDIWKAALEQAPQNERLKYLYLASDALLQSHRKFDEYVTAFQPVLPEAFALAHSGGPAEGKLRKSLDKILAIWEQRSVYSPEFLAKIRGALTSGAPAARTGSLPEVQDGALEPPVDIAALLRDLAQAERGMAATMQLRDVVRALPQDIFTPERFVAIADLRSLEETAETIAQAAKAIAELSNGASTLLRRHEALKDELERLMRQEQRAAVAVQKRLEASKTMTAQASATRKELKVHISNLPELDEAEDSLALPERPPSLEELIQSQGLAELSQAVAAAAAVPSNSDASTEAPTEKALIAERSAGVRRSSWSMPSRRSSLLGNKRAKRESGGEASSSTNQEVAAKATTPAEQDSASPVAGTGLFAVWSAAPSG